MFETARRKPGPGRSSVSLIGARFFALWVPDGYYYSAYVQEGVGDKYVVRFEDDNVEATLPLKHLRDCTKLEPGDTITLLRDNAVVADLADDGSFTARKLVDYSTIRISRDNVEREWRDRKPGHEDIFCGRD